MFFLRGASASTGRVDRAVGDLIEQGDIDAALQACKRLRGSAARVVASAVRNLDREREHIEDIVSEQILHESAHLNRYGTFIIVIAAVAPLLGLLGTGGTWGSCVTGQYPNFGLERGRLDEVQIFHRALEDFERHGRIRVHSESWEAQSDRPVRTGQRVRVVAMDGLKLKIEELDDA